MLTILKFINLKFARIFFPYIIITSKLERPKFQVRLFALIIPNDQAQRHLTKCAVMRGAHVRVLFKCPLQRLVRRALRGLLLFSMNCYFY